MEKSTASSKKAGTAASRETSKAVATVAGAASLPAFMQQDAAEASGKSNISRDDMVIPRVSLTQAVSDQATDGRCEVGNFWHEVLEEDLGPELNLIIVHQSKRYTLWNPRHSGGGVLARASDGKTWDADFEGEIQPYKDDKKKRVKFTIKAGDKVGRDIGLGKWGSLDPANEDSPPAATLSYVLVCFAPDRPEVGPFVILLQRSAEPVARQLMTKINLDPAPLYGQIYTAGSKDQASDNGGFKQFTFAKSGHVQDAEVYELSKTFHEQFQSTEVKFDETAAQAEAQPDTGGGEDTGSGGRDY